jgi:hypothetical protein
MGHLPSKSGGAAYRRLHRRLLRPVFSNIVINNIIATITSASERYVRCTAVRLFIIFCEYMFSCCLFSFILLFSTSSMFELYVIVAGIVMFNIMELIMKIVPNYPTQTKENYCKASTIGPAPRVEYSLATLTMKLRRDVRTRTITFVRYARTAS